MAKAKTYKMNSWLYLFREKCSLCDEKPKYRWFYYPTCMNGDAEWIWDFCETHKGIDLKKFSQSNIISNQ